MGWVGLDERFAPVILVGVRLHTLALRCKRVLPAGYVAHAVGLGGFARAHASLVVLVLLEVSPPRAGGAIRAVRVHVAVEEPVYVTTVVIVHVGSALPAHGCRLLGVGGRDEGGGQRQQGRRAVDAGKVVRCVEDERARLVEADDRLARERAVLLVAALQVVRQDVLGHVVGRLLIVGRVVDELAARIHEVGGADGGQRQSGAPKHDGGLVARLGEDDEQAQR